ncbi:MAG: hypothetical protein IJM59_10565 [Proteobacteria bacterium]|nr:hypothetical protein [Pseudomonadota bacterium]
MCFRLGRAYACGIRLTLRPAIAMCNTPAYGHGCGPACSTLGEIGMVCNDFGGEYYSHPAVCTQVGSNKILVDSSTSTNDYTECANGCNAAGTGCASGGQTLRYPCFGRHQ